MNMKAYLKGALAVLACTAGIAAHAQKNYPRPEPKTPGMSAYWKPQHAVVDQGARRRDGPPPAARAPRCATHRASRASAAGAPQRGA